MQVVYLIWFIDMQRSIEYSMYVVGTFCLLLLRHLPCYDCSGHELENVYISAATFLSFICNRNKGTKYILMLPPCTFSLWMVYN